MKKALRDSHAVFGCGFSGHFYYRDNYCAESAMITLVHLINIVSQTEVPLSERAAQLRRYHSSEEISLDVENKQAKTIDQATQAANNPIPASFQDQKLHLYNLGRLLERSIQC